MVKNINFRIGLFFLAFALFIIVFMVPTISEEWRQASTADVEFFTIGPRFFPYLATGIIGFLSVILIVQSWLRHRARSTSPGPVFTRGTLKAVLISTGIGMSYIVLIPLLGVIVVTPLCLAAYFWYFGLRRWVWIVVVPIVLTAFIYVSFGMFMMVPLPMGLLER
jgi:putative tricarboxylic transport membrane protein